MPAVASARDAATAAIAEWGHPKLLRAHIGMKGALDQAPSSCSSAGRREESPRAGRALHRALRARGGEKAVERCPCGAKRAVAVLGRAADLEASGVADDAGWHTEELSA